MRLHNHPLFGFFGSGLHLIISSRDGVLTKKEEPLSVPQLEYLVGKMDEVQAVVDRAVEEAHDGFAAVSEERRG